ncbi:MAG TPA: DUF72 domain-containing protein [Candidatus Polarisedimenticolia bacterium]|nr:DUF72 domain-containing protein [Candidatus Polarisedimenticolia bacterium]
MSQERDEPLIRVGVAGWDYPDWEGIVYPRPTPRGFDRLPFMAGHFDSLELNVTFYRQPDSAAAASWARRVADRPAFRFTAKLFRDLTHVDPAQVGRGDPTFRGEQEEMAAIYRAGIAPLHEAGVLGAVLLQFPQRFHDQPESRRHLERLAGLFEGLPLAAELRHRSWGHDEALQFLHRIDVGFCNVDQPALPTTLRPSGHVTSKVGYIRLHGRNAAAWFAPGENATGRYDYLYTEEELRPWVDRARRMADRAEEVFVIANNHYRGKAPANALMMRSMLEERKVQAPPDLVRTWKTLAPFATAPPPRRPAQGRLFD